jgi:hypothetical protein
VSFVNPVTVHESAPVVVQVKSPGVEVTVYKVIGEYPLLVGASHETVTDLSPLAPVTSRGADGTVGIVTAEVDAESGPAPSLFVADTVKV